MGSARIQEEGLSIVENLIDIPIEHERNVCGDFDVYLKKIERALQVTILERDGEIKIIGPEGAVARAKSIFSTLVELSKRGNQITEQNVDYAISLSYGGRGGKDPGDRPGCRVQNHCRQAYKAKNPGPEAICGYHP